jgi:hypothetical protein
MVEKPKLDPEFSPCERVVWVDIPAGRGAAGVESSCSAFTKPTVLAPSPGGDPIKKLAELRKALANAIKQSAKSPSAPTRGQSAT